MKVKINNAKAYQWIVLGLPLMWAMGLDQFVLPIVFIFLFIKRMLLGGMVFYRSPVMACFFGVICVSLLSVLMIDDLYRYVTWVRNVVTLTSGICLGYLVFESYKDIKEINNMLVCIAIYAFMVSIAGYVGSKGINLEFMSLAGRIFGTGGSGYLRQIFVKSLVQADASWFLAGFSRPRGIMMYANLMAGIILLGSFIKLYWFVKFKGYGLRRLAIVFLWGLDGSVILSSLSRSAWIGCAAAFLVMLIYVRVKLRVKVALVLLAVLVSLLGFLTGSSDLIERRFVEKGKSNEERGRNYEMIIDAVVSSPERIVLGFGTQRDVAELDIPLGSHSTYLGVLYKYGFLGLIAFVSGIVVLLYRLNKATSYDRSDPLFGSLLLALLVMMSVQGLFIELDVDVVYYTIWWILVGLGSAYTSITLKTRYKAENK